MNKKTGFTLVELLAVVLIIAILTAVALPQYRRAIQRTQATEALTNLRTIYDSAMRYRASYSDYPRNAKGLDVNFFEATHGTDYTNIGYFQYKFSASGVESCLRVGTNTNTFCIWMNYKKKTLLEKEYGPGTIFCRNKSGKEKYNYVCGYLGKQIEGSNDYIIE